MALPGPGSVFLLCWVTLLLHVDMAPSAAPCHPCIYRIWISWGFPPQNEVFIFLLRRESFCSILGYVGRSREGQGQALCVCDFPAGAEQIHPRAQPWFFPCFPASPAAGKFHRKGSFPYPSGTLERICWDTPGPSWHCHTWRRGECGEPGEGALIVSLSPLISTAANEH